jgi:hypothetical protein
MAKKVHGNPKPRASRRFMVTLPMDLYVALKTRSEQTRRGMSEEARIALEKHLCEQEEDQKGQCRAA